MDYSKEQLRDEFDKGFMVARDLEQKALLAALAVRLGLYAASELGDRCGVDLPVKAQSKVFKKCG